MLAHDFVDDGEAEARATLVGLRGEERLQQTLPIRLCNAVPEMTPQQMDDEAGRAARVFLRAYGTRR